MRIFEYANIDTDGTDDRADAQQAVYLSIQSSRTGKGRRPDAPTDALSCVRYIVAYECRDSAAYCKAPRVSHAACAASRRQCGRYPVTR